MSVRTGPELLDKKASTDQTSRSAYQREEAGEHSASCDSPRRLFQCDNDVQRCDAKQPCTQCSEGGWSYCVYEKSRIKQRMRKKPPAAAQTLPFSSKNKLGPRGSSPSWVNSEGFLLSAPDVPSPRIYDPVFSLTDQNLPNLSARGSSLPEFDTLDGFGPPGIVPISETKLVPSRGRYPNPSQPAPIPTFSILPSLRLPSVPRQLHTPLSLFSPERFQVSAVTTSSELDWLLCVFLPSNVIRSHQKSLLRLFSRHAMLLRSRQFGIYLPSPKQDAVLRGDLSGTVVHPWFVYVMAAFGVRFCAGVTLSPGMTQALARNIQRGYEEFVEIMRGSNADLTAQIFVSLAAITLRVRWLNPSRQCLMKACMILHAANLRFIPAFGRPPGLSEDVRERAVVLSQTIYFESYMFLAVDGTELKLSTRIEKEFRYELQVRVRFLIPLGVD